MKEQEPIFQAKPELTTRPQNRYSRGGDIFMDEGGRETGIGRPDAPRLQNRTPEANRPNLVTPEKIAQAKAQWELFNRGKGPLSVDELKTQQMIAEKGIPPIGGGAETIDGTGIVDPALRLQAGILNKFLGNIPDGDLPSQIDTLNQALNRISVIPGVDQDQLANLAERISDRLIILQRQAKEREAAQRREYAEGGRSRGAPVFVDKEEGRNINPDEYQHDRQTQEIATEVKETIEGGLANNDFLREKIKELFDRKQELGETAGDADLETAKNEIMKLRGQLQGIKEFLNSRERSKRLEENQSDWSTYGEMRLKQQEKLDLIDLVLAGEDEEVEEHFNRLFHHADTHSGDDWNEAQGTRGQIEVDDFTNALGAVASNRVAYTDRKKLGENGEYGVDRKLEDWEVNKLNTISRKLSQEVKLRQNLHNATFYVNKGYGIEDIGKLMKNFTAEDYNFAYKTEGVAMVQHFFENAILEIMAKNGGYIRAVEMVNQPDGNPGEVEKLVRDQIENAVKVGTLNWDTAHDKDGWKVDRAVSMARGMGIVSARTIELVALGGIPPVAGSSLDSWWANDIIKRVAFFRQLQRYDVGNQRNKVLAFKKEKQSTFWNKKELDIGNINDPKFLNRWINENDDDRLIDEINPMQVGSLYTQTGWRWTEENSYQAGAIARLLKDYKFNPIIGAGMWIEKQRRLLKSDKKLDNDTRVEAGREFSAVVNTEAELANLVIDRNLDLARKITPLKLFYNLTGLRQRVLQKYNQDHPGAIEEKRPGEIFIKDENLKKDLEVLSAIQEKLIRKRIDKYNQYLEAKKKNPNDPNVRPPDLYGNREEDKYLTDLDAEITALGDKLGPVQAGRIQSFVNRVRAEFDDAQKKKLIFNLKEKGWKVPFIFGTDDLPYDLYDLAATGSTSPGRRWGDLGSVDQAAQTFERDVLMNMALFKDQDQIIEQLNKFYQAMRGHDEGRTKDFMLDVVEGIGKFYKKDMTARLPVGLGMLKSTLTRVSYAQKVWGPDKMAWDELDMDTWIKKVQGAGLINEEDVKKLRERLGARRSNAFLALGRTGVPLGLLAFLYYLISAEFKDMKLAA